MYFSRYRAPSPKAAEHSATARLLPQFLRVPQKTDAPSAAAGAGFQHQGKAQLFRLRQRFLRASEDAGAGDGAEGGALHQLLHLRFVPQALHQRRVRPDEDDAAASAFPGKTGVFRKKAVTGMDGLGPGDQGGGEDALPTEIALFRGGGADAVTFVRQSRVKGVPVRFAAHGHRGDAHFLAGPDDAYRDLAPVGDQDL